MNDLKKVLAMANIPVCVKGHARSETQKNSLDNLVKMSDFKLLRQSLVVLELNAECRTHLFLSLR